MEEQHLEDSPNEASHHINSFASGKSLPISSLFLVFHSSVLEQSSTLGTIVLASNHHHHQPKLKNKYYQKFKDIAKRKLVSLRLYFYHDIYMLLQFFN